MDEDAGACFQNFYWQDGYAAFSLGPTGVGRVIRYIEIQKKHHQDIKFQDELRHLFKKTK